MINALALSLVFTSLLAAQVWSPNPANKKEDVIVKEGHRVVVVESFAQNGHHNTKVSISPPQDPISAVNGKFPSGLVENAKDKVKQGVSSVFDSTPIFTIDTSHCKENMHKAKEKVEDAYGKAKDKASETVHGTKETLENAYGSVTEKASEKAHEAKEFVGDSYGKATYTIENAYGKATDKASEKAHGAKEFVGDACRKATETIHGAKEVLENAYEKATDGAREAYEKTKDFAANKAHDVKNTAKDTKDMGKTIRTHTSRNISKQIGNLKTSAGRAATGIFRGFKDEIRYLSSLQWLDPLFGVINLLGFAIAYGIGMWVTFISSHVLAGSLPRHQFGLVQSKIYPVYFRAMGSSITMALLGHIGEHRNHLFSGSKAGLLQVFNLLATLLPVLINAFYLEPLATKVMMEKFRLEKEEGRGREMQSPERGRAEEAAVAGIVESAIAEAREEAEQQEQREIRERMGRPNERLKKLNSYSSLLNIVTLMGLTWHLVHLGHCVPGTS